MITPITYYKGVRREGPIIIDNKTTQQDDVID